MQHEILGRVPLIDSMDGLPHDLAVLDTRIGPCWTRVAGGSSTGVDPSGVRDRKAALRQEWPGLATALDDLAACPDLVTLLSH